MRDNLFLLFFPLIICSVLQTSCVRKKIYRVEQSSRNAAEARELVLIRELGDRKQEAKLLVDTIGSLNRSIGKLQNKVADLMAESDLKSLEYGASSIELRSMLATTQKKLQKTQNILADKNGIIQAAEEKKARQAAQIIALNEDFSKVLIPWLNQGVRMENEKKELVVTLPNRLIYDSYGLSLSSSGRTVLHAISTYLTQHPELDVAVETHTDYNLPSGIEDSWDWSARRAQVICRTLEREFNVNGNQLTPICKGEYQPVASNETANGQEMNRRTILRVRKPNF